MPTWTGDFENEFRKYTGRDIRPDLPLLAGFVERDSAVTETFIQPTVWLGALACGLAALVGSALVGRGSVGAGIAGQAIGCAVVVAGLLYAAHMENGGIWAPPDAPTIACAVSLTICMCIATVLRGPLEWDQEGEDS